MENRIKITFLQMIFLEEYSNCEDSTLYPNVGRSVKARFLKHATEMTELINTKILGDELNPAQFRFPFNEEQDNIGTIRISNPIARLIVSKIDLLISKTCSNNSREVLWKRKTNNANLAVVILRKRTDYTEFEILKFQELIDMFAQDWLELWGKAGITNYIHMAISGHIANQMSHFK